MNTRPENINLHDTDVSNLLFCDIFDVEEIQHIQDLFSDATGVASILIQTDGTPITRPSNFCRLCNTLIQNSGEGRINCFKPDIVIVRSNPPEPVVQACLSGALRGAEAGITVGGKRIANWLIGQVRNEDLDEKRMIQYAWEIGVNREDFMEALREVPVMSVEQFNKVSKMLISLASELSEKATLNLQLKKLFADHEKALKLIQENEERYQTLIRQSNDAIRTSERESEEKYKMITQSSLDIIFIVDIFGKQLFFNESVEKVLGYKVEETIGRSFTEFVPKSEWLNYFSQLKNVFSHNQIINFVTKVYHKDGHLVDVEINGKLVKQGGEYVGQGTIRDITERKRAEAEIKLKNEQLVKLIAEKDKFFSIIAHDLRSPFYSFLGLTQMMTEDLPHLTMDQIREIAGTMRNSAANLFRLLENLLHWSLMQQGLIPFNPEILHLHAILEESLEMIIESANEKGISIAYDIPAEIEVYADTTMLQTIMRNLVSNAVKFTRNGGKIILSARAGKHDGIKIAVKDSGIGMNRIIINNLFQLDVQTSREGTDGEPSTGLGLLLCKEFIEKHGGKIKIKSQEGKGSVFSFTLPSNKQ